MQVVLGDPERGAHDDELREAVGALTPADQPMRQRQEYLAMLARWYYSSWRDGEWFAFDSLENLPYRKLVHAISRVAHKAA